MLAPDLLPSSRCASSDALLVTWPSTFRPGQERRPLAERARKLSDGFRGDAELLLYVDVSLPAPEKSFSSLPVKQITVLRILDVVHEVITS
jgi:hypothetical protein